MAKNPTDVGLAFSTQIAYFTCEFRDLTMRRPFLYNCVAALLATNYFAFQVEVFEEEYEANHRSVSPDPAIGSPTVTWESFDKTNAPKAFVFNAEVSIILLLNLEHLSTPFLAPRIPVGLVRDKSPPLSA